MEMATHLKKKKKVSMNIKGYSECKRTKIHKKRGELALIWETTERLPKKQQNIHNMENIEI